MALDSSTKGFNRSLKLVRRTRVGAVGFVGAVSWELVSHAAGQAGELGPCSAGPESEPGTGVGGGGGVLLPPDPEAGAGDTVSFKPGSSSSRALGSFSTVELRTDPLPEGAGAVDVLPGKAEFGVSTSEGTELTVLPVDSSVTVGPEPPQLVQGAATGTGLEKTGR